MTNIWDKIYKKDSSFFGDEPSDFAVSCHNVMRDSTKTLLELGCGQGRDCMFFASKGITVNALDYSRFAIEQLSRRAKQKDLPIEALIYNATQPFPFNDNIFDAVYSHMFFSMNFTKAQLRFLFDEVKRVLKPNGIHFFSVRSDKDKMYGTGRQVGDGVYDINGFKIRFFTKNDIAIISSGFKIEDISEGFEEPASLYLVTAKKT